MLKYFHHFQLSKYCDCLLFRFLLFLLAVYRLNVQVFAESYMSYVSFHLIYSGLARTYTGDQISIYMASAYLTGSSPEIINRYFTVECWKDGFWVFDTKLSGNLNGIAYAEHSGYTPISASKSWAMIGNGKYYFKFINNYVYGSESINSYHVMMSSN